MHGHILLQVVAPCFTYPKDVNMKRAFVLLIILSAFVNLRAQELNCMVSVNHQQIQGSNIEVFRTMQSAIFEFMNTTKWTEHVYGMDERIECTMMINLNEMVGSDRFEATITMQSMRPVFNTSYNSTLLNYQEKKGTFRFSYIENQPLEFNENAYTSELTSVLAFYAYIIIGLDYDTFGEMAGQEYFDKARKIASNALNSTEPGWQAYEGTENRYWLIEDLLNPSYSPLRRCMYRYHRLGLDVMSEKNEAGLSEIFEALKLLKRVHQYKPSSFLMKLFFTAKADEIVDLFKGSNSAMQKSQVVALLKEIDPGNAARYDEITRQEQ